MARVLRQGPAVLGCEGRTCAEHSARLLSTSPFPFQRAASGSRVDSEDMGGGSRGMHYNTANQRELTKEHPSMRAGSSRYLRPRSTRRSRISSFVRDTSTLLVVKFRRS